MQSVYRFLFVISKTIHKYTGLVFLLYFLMMGITGILINHPSLLRGITVPAALLPDVYHFANWNRMALREVVFSKKKNNHSSLYLAGKAGIFKSLNGGKTFDKMSDGLPTGIYDLDTKALLLVEENEKEILFAGTRRGLYFCDPDKGHWHAVENKELQQEEIIDLVQAGNRIYAFTAFNGYLAHTGRENLVFNKIMLESADPAPDRVAMFRFLLKLHDGSVLGLPGKLFVDTIGVILLFLSISSLYLWYIPWSRKKFKSCRKPRFFKFFYKYHLKLGIYSAFFLLIIALTGVFIRPPLLISIINVQVPAWLYPQSGNDNWHAKIQRAVYLQDEDALLLATENGFYKGQADLSEAFTKQKIKVPVHGMGAFVLEPLQDNRLLVGSFSGIYIWDRKKQEGRDLQGKLLPAERKGRIMAGGMAAGAVVKDGQPLIWVDYRNGIQIMENKSIRALPMPPEIEKSGMSLWHFLFECHNGRIFRSILGKYTWLVVPLGGFLLLLSVLTGSYDWLFRKLLARKRVRNGVGGGK